MNESVKESDWKLFRKNFRDGRKLIWEELTQEYAAILAVQALPHKSVNYYGVFAHKSANCD
jgi:hypothetical protein